MADLRTRYMGIELKSPIIAGASNMVTDIHKLQKLEQAGVAAIVYNLSSKSRYNSRILSYTNSKLSMSTDTPNR